jgi:NHLM bacteriocin system ABC transporter peptidase/ATP-binding protein
MSARHLTAVGEPVSSRPVTTPTVLQLEASECGAAALAIVLAHHGRVVPLEELRVACGVSRDGSKASNIVKAARAYGLTARGLKKETGELRALVFPAILFWNFNHYVVLEGFTGGRVHINDPAMGRRTVSLDELESAFTGVVLAFEPGPAFVKAGSERSIVRALLGRLSSSRVPLLFLVLAGLALVLPSIAVPAFTRVYVDEVLIHSVRDWARPLLLLMLAAAMVASALVWLQEKHLVRLSTKQAVVWSSRFFWHLLRLPHRFFTQRYPGEVAVRTSIDDRIALLLSGELASAILSFVLVIAYGLLMLRYDVVLAAVTITAAMLNLVCLRAVARRRADFSLLAAQERGKLLGISMSGLQTIETLKASSTESDFFSRWAGQSAKTTNAEVKLEVFHTLVSAVPPVLTSITLVAIYCIGGYRSMSGLVTVGTLIAFQAVMTGFSAPFSQLVGMGGRIQEAGADLARSEDVLRHELDAEHERADAGAASMLKGRVQLIDVTFGYGRFDPPLIDGFNLHVMPGQRVALAGASGSGKSTLAKLICGLLLPSSGEVRFDGHLRKDLAKSVLTTSLAYVDQDVLLFAGTLRDNLTLWDESVPEGAIVAALRDAAVFDEVVVRGGLEMIVGEGGANLSGGQRQRIEIARALISNPSILVLDEATSALDATTEQAIDESLRRRGCTCIIAAHRLSTVRDADEIIVLDRGKVVERGTHEQLMIKGGAYRQLVETR